jgi:hypothetical protein
VRVRGHADRLPELAREMVRTEADFGGHLGKRDVAPEVCLQVLEGAPQPAGRKPARVNWCRVCPSPGGGGVAGRQMGGERLADGVARRDTLPRVRS